MSISIQHVRGSILSWADKDPVVPDGEIALVMQGDHYRAKIGDGACLFSELPFLGLTKKYLNAGYTTIYTQANYSYVYTALLTKIKLSLPDPSEDEFVEDFRMFVTFNTTTAKTPVFSTTETTYFTGEDCASGTFTPVADKHYNVFVYYDGTFQGIVRGVPYTEA